MQRVRTLLYHEHEHRLSSNWAIQYSNSIVIVANKTDLAVQTIRSIEGVQIAGNVLTICFLLAILNVVKLSYIITKLFCNNMQ